MPGFKELMKPPAGPTYTDLAREVDRLKAKNAELYVVLVAAERAWSASHDLNDAAHHAAMMNLRKVITTQGHPGTALLDEMERLKNTVKTLNRRDGEIRQQAFLDFAHELAEMEPAARDTAIRRIIDSAQ